MANPINIKKLLKRKYYWQGFNGTPGLLIFGAASSCKYMYKYLGYGYTSLVDLYENDKCYYGYAWGDLFNIWNNLKKNLDENKNYLFVLEQKHNAINKKHLAFLQHLDTLNISKLSDKELIAYYQQLAEAFNELLGVSHMVEGFTLTQEDRIREKVKEELKEKGLENRYNAFLTELTNPVVPSFIGEAHNDIRKAALLFLEDKRLKKLIEKKDVKGIKKKINNYKNIKETLIDLEKKYYWLNNGYAGAKDLGIDYFINEIMLDIERGLDKNAIFRYKDSFSKNKEKKEKLLKELKLSKELVQLLRVHDFITWLHDDRKHKTTISLGYLDNFLKEIGRRFGIKHDNVRYLVQAEISIENLKKITDEQLAKRREKSIFFSTDKSQKARDPLKRFVGYTGSKADAMIKQLLAEKVKEVTEIRGNCASPGKVTGIVKVCRGANEIAKVGKGDILVACMTQPEFVPAMKKAVAAITDEGGLTCHAAIISRELKIPCVIGTKNATKVLKDGMLVEVDADKGMVRILRK